MAKITIDGKEYEEDSLTLEAKEQMHMIRLADQEIGHLNVQLAMAQTARIAYAKALQKELDAIPVVTNSAVHDGFDSDTISFS